MDLSASAPGVYTSATSTLTLSGSSDMSAKLYQAQFNHVGIRLVAHTPEQTAAAGIKTQPPSRADFEDALYLNVIEAPLKSLSHQASDYKTMMQYDDSGFYSDPQAYETYIPSPLGRNPPPVISSRRIVRRRH
jgi:hypothetical protein